jgi:hypothetical protein
MLDLYFRPTRNGKRVVVLLKECGLPYTIKLAIWTPVRHPARQQWVAIWEAHLGHALPPRVYTAKLRSKLPIAPLVSR